METSEKQINMDVLFIHNVYNRPKTLIKTIKLEKKYFPNAKIIIVYNNKNKIQMKLFKSLEFYEDLEMFYYSDTTHKIGCTNGFIYGLKLAKKYTADVCFFSHDDVFINQKRLMVFKRNLMKIARGDYDIICRKPLKGYGNNYYMMEGVFMNKKKVEKIIEGVKPYKSEEDIPKDIRGSISPEVFLYNLFKDKGLKIQSTTYDNTSEHYNMLLGDIMGLHHFNIGKRGWKEENYLKEIVNE